MNNSSRRVSGTVPRLPVTRLPPGGSLGTPKTLGTGATFHLDRYVYSSKIWSAVPKDGQHGAKDVPCRTDFLARVNGV